MPRSFSERLTAAMKARGHVSGVARSGVDVTALARAAGCTYEMARRYSEGRAIPRPDKLDRIAAWLNTTPAELLYGEPAAGTDRIISTEVLQACISAAKRAEQLSGESLEPEKAARLVALLYEEAIDGRPASAGLIARLLRLL